MNTNANIWDQGKTGYDFHAFVDGVALCHKGRKATPMFAANARDLEGAKKFARQTPGAAMCDKCMAKFEAMAEPGSAASSVENDANPVNAAEEAVTPIPFGTLVTVRGRLGKVAHSRTVVRRDSRTILYSVEFDDGTEGIHEAGEVEERQSYAGTGYVKDLMMGDVFRLPGNPHEVFGPVRSADSDYMLYGTVVDFGHGKRRECHAWTRVEHIKRGPKCGCGRFLELCEEECPWPEEMEALFMAH